MAEVTSVFMPNCVLLEGCVWNRNENVLYFVDIEGRTAYRLCPEDGSVTCKRAAGRIGCLVPHKEGGIVLAETNRLVHGSFCEDTEERVLLQQDFPAYLRYNDGKCDRYGNLWVGTMAIDQSHPKANGGGSLYCIQDGQIAASYGGYTIPNGLVWNEDGTNLYHIDTALQKIEVYDVEENIRLTGRRTAIEISPEEGSPDGMCMDAEGNLWVAMWGGSRVNGYDRISGKKIHEIRVPDQNVSCCCFGGLDGKTLYITTARDKSGNGGHLYQTYMPVRGSKIYEYGGCCDDR